MKVIIENNFIETSMITNIKVYEEKNSDYVSINLDLNFIGNSNILSIPIGFSLTANPNHQEELLAIDEKIGRMMKFIEDHSDKPNWPYPTFM